MANDELDKVELPALEQLQSLGWSYVEGAKLSPDESDERSSLKDVVLEKRLTESLKRINPWINDENLRKVISDLKTSKYSNLLEANQSIWEMLTQSISVSQDLGKGKKGQTVHFIDFDNPENNEFLCTNQFKVKGPIQNIIPDIILFINGLPLAVIECKSPFISHPMKEGINQLLRYANLRNPEESEGCENLFHYNQMMISTHKDKARLATISARIEHYLEWKDPYPHKVEDIGKSPSSQEVLIDGVCNKYNFLDLIRNFIVFEAQDGQVVKKMARYQQFRAVQKTLDRLKTQEKPKERGGIVWHTQGSGKSLTMVFLAVKIRNDPILKDYKLVFLTDRTQLDRQLTDTFRRTQSQTVYAAKNVDDFMKLLAKDSSDIVTGTMQKFRDKVGDETIGEVNASDRILLISDEAHRTQYSTFAALMNEALPNATKIAFTGTPLIQSEKTKNEFGSYIDTYTIEQSVKDGSTVKIIYEGREAKTKVTGEDLDRLFEECFVDYDDEQKTEVKKKYGTQGAILESKNRIREVCKDIIEHYTTTIKPNGFKAMIVTNSRNAAVTYKEIFDELKGPESAVIISGDHNDEGRLRKFTDSTVHKKEEERFKKSLDDDPLSFLIVKDMLLTGFDAPVCQVMYLDRKLIDHNLLQAIARVNRTKVRKNAGYIVDYYGLSDYLSEALEVFSSDDVKGALINIEEEIPHLKAFHTNCLKYFMKLDLKDIDECIKVLKDEKTRHDFEFDFRQFSKQMDIVLPNKAASFFIKDLRLLGKICHGARNLYRDPRLDIEGAGEKVKKLIEDHLVSTGVDIKIAPVDLLADDFKEKIGEHKSSETRALDMEHAIRHYITINIDEDPAYYQSLSEKLENIIRENQGRWEQLELDLMSFRDSVVNQRGQEASTEGLSLVEFAFFNLLTSEVKNISKKEDLEISQRGEIREMVKELVQKMDEASNIVNFFKDQNAIKRVQLEIRRTIINSSFDSLELRKIITEEFMELAKVHFSKNQS